MSIFNKNKKANEKQVGGDHYKSGMQHWDMVTDLKLGYFEGNITKYVTRARKKGGEEDMGKALHYTDKLMETAGRQLKTHLMEGDYDVRSYIATFSAANELTPEEARAVLLVCTWDSLADLEAARGLLQELGARAG